MGQADLHIHTTYSLDATTTVRGVLEYASRINLDVIAISDHDQIRGALEARELASQYHLEVITGTEVTSLEGHVLALFVEKLIPAGLPFIETLVRIGDLGGIAIAPHPVNPLPKSLDMQSIMNAMAHEKARHVLKGIEIYNMGHEIFNYRAKKLSSQLPLAKTGSSDSHIHWTIGSGRTEFPGTTASDLRAALENRTTKPIPASYSFTMRPIISWVGHMVLRRLFGLVTDSAGPGESMVIRRMHLM